MRKTVAITLLSLSLLAGASPAFAALDHLAIENTRLATGGNIPVEWPVATVCSGSDVNIRSGPTTEMGEILGSLQIGDAVYVKEFTDNVYNGYPWAHMITDRGVQGYVNARYLDLQPDAMSRSKRFLAAFNSSVFFELNSLIGSYEDVHGNGFSAIEAKDRKFAGAKFKLAIGSYDVWAHCDDDSSANNSMNVRMWGATMTSSNRTAAGLRVGQSMDDSEFLRFRQDMESIGWYYLPGDRDEHLFRNETYLVELPNSKGFGFSCRNDKIDEIFWCSYPADN